jgi:hypothetical protein
MRICLLLQFYGPGTVVGLFGKVTYSHRYLLPAFEEIFVGVNTMYARS